jgi:hypothetical protein
MAENLGLPKPRVYQLLFKARRAMERALGESPSCAAGPALGSHPS